jgi:PIN domain nuclease of toxin-antitoxin system
MRFLLDTATLLFAVNEPHRLSSRATAALANPANVRNLSAVSLTEIAIKANLGKLDASAAPMRQAIEDMDLRALPFMPEHAFRLFELPLRHRDPFDRQLIAQALVEEIPVLTPDSKFKLYPGVRVIW